MSEPVKKWYCVRTKQKQEAIASCSIKELDGVEVFCPLIRFKKSTRRGKVWFQEALFPGYIFVKCNLNIMFKAINYSRGVACLVHFGSHYPSIGKNEINTLRREVNDDEIIVINQKFEPGQKTRIVQGPFKGLSVVINRIIPPGERICVLLDLLGGKIQAEVKKSALASCTSRPQF